MGRTVFDFGAVVVGILVEQSIPLDHCGRGALQDMEVVVPIVSIELIVHEQTDYIVVDVRHMVVELETGQLLVSWLRKLLEEYETGCIVILNTGAFLR